MSSGTLHEKIRAVLPSFDAQARRPGGAVGVVRGGKLAFAQGYGLADVETGVPFAADTHFHICSITKTFTGALVGLLEAEGRLSLAHEARAYWPELPVYGVELTLAHLVTNTSGLRDYFPLAFLEEGFAPSAYDRAFLERHALRAPSLMFAPGSRFAYSNSNFVLLCRILERLENAPYSDILRRRVLAPLGMRNTSFITQTLPHPDGAARGYFKTPSGWRSPQLDVHEAGDGGIWSSIEDLARWASALLSGSIAGAQIVPRLREPPVLADGERSRYACGLGLGWRNGAPWFGHAGGLAGMSTNIACFPEHDLAVVAASNDPDEDAETLSLRVADLFLPQPSPAPPKPSVRPAQELAGLWHDPESGTTAEITLHAHGASVWIQGWSFDVEARSAEVLENDTFESSVRLLGRDVIELRPSWGRKFTLRRLAPADGPLGDIAAVYEGVDVRARHEVMVCDDKASLIISRADGGGTTCALERLGANVFGVRAPDSDQRSGAIAMFAPDGAMVISLNKAERVRFRRAN